MKYIISRTVDKVTADSVAVERSLWNMSRQHTGHHEIDVNTLNQLHEQGEAISPILKDAWCLDVNSLFMFMFMFIYFTTEKKSLSTVIFLCISGPFDSARANRSAVTSPNFTPLPLRSINHRVLHFFMRVRESPKGIKRVFVQFQFILPTKKNKTKQKTSIQKYAEAMWWGSPKRNHKAYVIPFSFV